MIYVKFPSDMSGTNVVKGLKLTACHQVEWSPLIMVIAN